MSLLRRTLARLQSGQTNQTAVVNPAHSLLLHMTAENTTGVVQVAKIDNGFLVLTRTWNAHGPDGIRAVYVPDAASIGSAVVAELAYQTLTK